MIKVSFTALFLVCALALLYSCNSFTKKVSGNGTVTTENRKVFAFTKLKVDGVFKTIISQDGGPAWIKVETDQNLQDIIEAANVGDVLEVHLKKGTAYIKSTKMVVYVNVKELSSLENKSVGAIETQGTIKSPELDLHIAAVGKTTLDIQVQKLTADIASVGATDLSGIATVADIENKSIGKLRAYDLKVDTLTIRNKAIGGVEIYAEKQLTIDHDGIGSLYYKGPAVITSLKQNGIGKVSKAD